MPGNIKPRKKKPVSQKRVAIVLASLVGTLTLSAGALLLMEDGASAWSTPGAVALAENSVQTIVGNQGQLQSERWKYIIIYESGDMAGSAASLAEGRLEGVAPVTRRPAEFHFVIGNGSGVSDGGIETESSWLNQEIGTPTVGWPNIRTNKNYTNAVGICSIGNLSQRPPTELQTQSLLQLVNELRVQCHIPAENVKFAWELNPNDRTPPTAGQKAFADQIRHRMD